MFRELCNPVTMNLMALGHPLHRAERLAAVIVLWVVLLCTMTGCTISVTGIPQQARDDETGLLYTHAPAQGSHIADICGILPVVTGNAGRHSRTLLQR
jgi:hypothetical protein